MKHLENFINDPFLEDIKDICDEIYNNIVLESSDRGFVVSMVVDNGNGDEEEIEFDNIVSLINNEILYASCDKNILIYISKQIPNLKVGDRECEKYLKFLRNELPDIIKYTESNYGRLKLFLPIKKNRMRVIPENAPWYSRDIFTGKDSGRIFPKVEVKEEEDLIIDSISVVISIEIYKKSIIDKFKDIF